MHAVQIGGQFGPHSRVGEGDRSALQPIPKLRQGSYFPGWLLERRKRAERALTTYYLLGVSAWRMDKLVVTSGITSLSKYQVIVMAKELDAAVEASRPRPQDAGSYTFVAADALALKVREGALTPKSSWSWVRTLLHSVFGHLDTESVFRAI